MVDPAGTFRYERPDGDAPKEIEHLARTDSFKADVQLVGEDGANNMHAHTGNDGFWMVLAGEARFYGDGDEVLAELEPDEGIVIPRGLKYWFESIGDEDLEILHVASFYETIEDHRMDHAERDRAPASTDEQEKEYQVDHQDD